MLFLLCYRCRYYFSGFTAIDCYLLNPALVRRHGDMSLRIAPRFYPDKIKADLRDIYSSILK